MRESIGEDLDIAKSASFSSLTNFNSFGLNLSIEITTNTFVPKKNYCVGFDAVLGAWKRDGLCR